MIRIESDWKEIDAELDRLSRMPDAKAKFMLDAVLEFGFMQTEAAVHVETGALKASGKVSSESNRVTQTWEGEIRYGNAEVDYAIYEKARGVGGAGGPSDAKGDHNFMAPTKTLGPLFKKALKAVLSK